MELYGIYASTILLMAGIITLVAAAAGAIIYLRAKYGAGSATFQLARVGLIWISLIGTLLLGGLLIALLSGYTASTLGEFSAFCLDWARHNRMMAEIIVDTIAILACIEFHRNESCTIMTGIAIALLAVVGSYLIWQAPIQQTWTWLKYEQFPVWPVIKAIIMVIVIAICVGSGDFDELNYSNYPATPPTRATSNGASTSNSSNYSHLAVEVLGDIIAECAENLAATAQQDQ